MPERSESYRWRIKFADGSLVQYRAVDIQTALHTALHERGQQADVLRMSCVPVPIDYWTVLSCRMVRTVQTGKGFRDEMVD